MTLKFYFAKKVRDHDSFNKLTSVTLCEYTLIALLLEDNVYEDSVFSQPISFMNRVALQTFPELGMFHLR